MQKALIALVLIFLPTLLRAETVIDLDDTISSKCTSFSNEISDAQINVISSMFSQRSHRLWHLFFHGLRSAWPSLSQGDKDLLAVVHSSLVVVRPYSLTDSSNFASEDFIYMHRLMIRMVREKLVASGLPCIAGFDSVPRVNDPTWPVPPLWFSADGLTKLSKSLAGFQSMSSLDSKFHDSAWLKSQSASNIAGHLEGFIHMMFHHRFSADPIVAQRPLLSIYSEPAPKYVDAKYSFLLDTFSSSLPKAFWKLHGYIENTSLRWLAAQGYSSVSIQCKGRAGCYQWNNTWLGPSPEAVCTCDHDHVAGSGEEHETDILKLITEYANANPDKAAQLDSILQTIDRKSAPGNN